MRHWHIEIQPLDKSDTRSPITIPGFYLWHGVADGIAELLRYESHSKDNPAVIECESADCEPTFYRQ